jgi:hypothetical protein
MLQWHIAVSCDHVIALEHQQKSKKEFCLGSCASTWKTSENRECEGALHWLVML